jgi:prepilin-type processing-associated H-X9-DG protein
MRPNGFLAAFADGHVSFIAKNLDPKMLGYLFMYNDGNPVQLPEDQPPAGRRGPGPRAAPPPAAIPGQPRGKAVPLPRPAAKAKAA